MSLYRLFLRHQLTWGRVAVIVALGAVSVLISLAMRAGADDRLVSGTEFLNDFAFTIVVPVCTLLFASSALGDTVDDRTLVYLWLSPVRRWRIAAAAALAAVTVTVPLVLVPTVAAAAAIGAGGDLVVGAAVATVVGVVGYAGLFTALGLRVRRALMWGLAYVLLWEGFVATASETAAKLSLRAYTASILARSTGVDLRLGTLTMASGIVVPIVVGVAFTALTGWLLVRAEVD